MPTRGHTDVRYNRSMGVSIVVSMSAVHPSIRRSVHSMQKAGHPMATAPCPLLGTHPVQSQVVASCTTGAVCNFCFSMRFPQSKSRWVEQIFNRLGVLTQADNTAIQTLQYNYNPNTAIQLQSNTINSIGGSFLVFSVVFLCFVHV